MYLTRYGWNLGNLLESFLVLPYLFDSVKGRLKNSHTGKSTQISDPLETEEKELQLLMYSQGQKAWNE